MVTMMAVEHVDNNDNDSNKIDTGKCSYLRSINRKTSNSNVISLVKALTTTTPTTSFPLRDNDSKNEGR
jgi:hypothetical protein